MAITLPSSVTTANVDAASDDPKQARADILDLITKFNTILGQINALGITQVGDGLEVVAAAAGTKDGVATKLDGTSLARSAAGLKVNAGGITLAMIGNNSAANGNIIVFDSTLNAGAGGWKVAAPASSGNQKLKYAVFTSAGTTSWTVPSGVTEAKVTVVGGGGSGGTANASVLCAGGGGGGGGAAVKWLTGLTPGNSINVTVGASDGASFVGPSGSELCRASAGSGGSNGTSGAPNGLGGAGGVGTVGDILLRGSPGLAGVQNSSGGNGGAAALGGGGAAQNFSDAAGSAASAGGGGGAGGNNLTLSPARSGGSGGAGLVIIEWVAA